MVKINGVNRRKKHSKKKKQHRYGNRQPQFVLRYDQVLPLLFISRSLNLHEHKKIFIPVSFKKIIFERFLYPHFSLICETVNLNLWLLAFAVNLIPNISMIIRISWPYLQKVAKIKFWRLFQRWISLHPQQDKIKWFSRKQP